MAEAVDALWQRATLAAAHDKPELAAQLLKKLLEVDPEHAPAHALLARLAVDGNRRDEALALARRGVALAPELAYAHHALAYVHWVREEGKAAIASAHEACRLAPHEPNHNALAAQIFASQHRWHDALVHAEWGLELDAAHTACLNLRAIALRNMGRGDEANATLEHALAEDPENAYTHQNQGWALLQRGDTKGAIAHFQEALRRDASLDGARAGLVEALKARNPFYRLVLSGFLWLSRYSAARQRQILLGLFVASFVGRRLLASAGHPEAARVAGYAWLGFVVVLTCIVPFFNFLLLLHPIGRHALGKVARRDAILLGLVVLAFVGIAVTDQITPSPATDLGFWLTLLLLFPVAGLGTVREGWPLRGLQAFCAIAAAFCVWCIASTFSLQGEAATATAARREELGSMLGRNATWSSYAMWSFVLSSWYVMFLSGRRRRS